MKITSFNPLILTKDAENAVKVFEALGFEKKHTNADVIKGKVSNFTLEDSNGFKTDVASVSAEVVPQDRILIRMNVDNFDEAYEFLTSKGFVNKTGRIVELKSSKSAMMVSPSGFAFDLCYHKKEND